MRFGEATLIAIVLLTTGISWAGGVPHYGMMNIPRSTMHVVCTGVDDDLAVVGTCNNMSDGTPLHLEEDCEITAVTLTGSAEWYGHAIIVVDHPAPARLISSQVLSLESESGLSGLSARFVVHITADADGSFTAGINAVTLQCRP
jgi:hypothetical protein